MSSIGRVTAALGAASIENTLALANLNFDFSLIKVEAPPEFRQLGANLSDHRREEAETGIAHRTARKLGALFAGTLPFTPALIKAYGLRVSEISQSSRHNPKGKREDGPFSAHIGADGTAIWAAATSGSSAIPMLMLACLLARLWSASEATSLWVELVSHRRKELKDNHANDDPALFAAMQDITRSQLADWDASARSWLKTADTAKAFQQTQLMLVVNNLQLPVSNNANVYQSVIESSRSALSLMEDLLNGQPQRAQSGAFFLGLSAWHLYPDLVVHGTVTKKIAQNDDLFPIGTMVTVGLESRKEMDNGVYWSLPLAHLRFYGEAVISSRSTGHDASRITMDQLIYVALGALSADWVAKSTDLKKVLSWFSHLSNHYKRAATEREGSRRKEYQEHYAQDTVNGSGWLKLLMTAADVFPKLRENEQENSRKLMSFGYRRFGNFLAESPFRPPAFFGLQDLPTLFRLMESDEERIRLLRKHAESLRLDRNRVIIRYKRAHDKRYWMNFYELSPYEYASAIPIARSPPLNTGSQSDVNEVRHQRWIASSSNYEFYSKICEKSSTEVKQFPLLESMKKSKAVICCCRDGCSSACLCLTFIDGCIDGCFCRISDQPCHTNISSGTHAWAMSIRVANLRSLGEDCIEDCPRSFVDHFRQPTPIRKLHDTAFAVMKQNYGDMWHADKNQALKIWRLKNCPWYVEGGLAAQSVTMDLLYGDPESAALYVLGTSPNDMSTRRKSSVEELWELLETGAIDLAQLSRYLIKLEESYCKASIISLKSLAAAKKLYKDLHGTTIALTVAAKPLYRSLWVSPRKKRGKNPDRNNDKKVHYVSKGDPWLNQMSLASGFACIANFESGAYDIDPTTLEHVFAMSSENSLFIAAPLINDPSKGGLETKIKRVVGNIGRAGVAMLIPPQDPQIRKPQVGDWELISHAQFDGQPADSFQNTTHHLSFTQYTMPCNTGKHGAQDVEAFFIESLVSVHDREKWVADLDVLSMFHDSKLDSLHSLDGPIRGCKHPAGMLPQDELTAIDTWEELLDREQGPVVVRAVRNPVARLATAVLSLKKGYRTVLVPEQICWTCVTEKFQSNEKTLTFIQ